MHSGLLFRVRRVAIVGRASGVIFKLGYVLRNILLAVLIVALTGCTGFLPPKHDAALAGASTCCHDFSTLPYRDLAGGQRIRELIGPDTPVFEFPQGKSFFLAVHFMKGDGSKLIVRTYPQNMLYNPDGHVFVPRITFLSSHFEVISSISPEFTVQSPTFGIGESAWRVDLPVPSQAIYAVIHTGDVERRKTMRMRDHDQIGGYLYTRTGPAGEVEIELQ